MWQICVISFGSSPGYNKPFLLHLSALNKEFRFVRYPPPFTFWSSFIFSNMLTKPLEHTAHKVHRERETCLNFCHRVSWKEWKKEGVPMTQFLFNFDSLGHWRERERKREITYGFHVELCWQEIHADTKKLHVCVCMRERVRERESVWYEMLNMTLYICLMRLKYLNESSVRPSISHSSYFNPWSICLSKWFGT